MVLILVIASPPLMTDGAVCKKRVRLHGLDLSTKHVVDDPREPEIEKPALRQAKDNKGRTMPALWAEDTLAGFGAD